MTRYCICALILMYKNICEYPFTTSKYGVDLKNFLFY